MVVGGRTAVKLHGEDLENPRDVKSVKLDNGVAEDNDLCDALTSLAVSSVRHCSVSSLSTMCHRSVSSPTALAPDVDSLEVLLHDMCLCTTRYLCESCVVGQLSRMVENLLEPGAETEQQPTPLIVPVKHPLSGELISCAAIKLGRFTVVEHPPTFLDAPTDLTNISPTYFRLRCIR